MIIKNITKQYFDWKSAQLKPSDIVKHLIAFANANGEITGFGYSGAHTINEFLEAPYLLEGNIKAIHEEKNRR